MDWMRIVDQLKDLVELGGPVVALLALLSVVVVTILLAKLLQFRRAGVGQGRNASNSPEDAESDLGRRMAEGMRAGHSPDFLRAQAAQMLAGYQTGFRLLDNIAQIAPLLGLFGTVLGMIDAFRALQAAGSTVDPAALAGGIWVALLTTAAGLAVAMPTSLALSWLESRVQRAARQADWIIERAAEAKRTSEPEVAHAA